MLTPGPQAWICPLLLASRRIGESLGIPYLGMTLGHSGVHSLVVGSGSSLRECCRGGGF